MAKMECRFDFKCPGWAAAPGATLAPFILLLLASSAFAGSDAFVSGSAARLFPLEDIVWRLGAKLLPIFAAGAVVYTIVYLLKRYLIYTEDARMAKKGYVAYKPSSIKSIDGKKTYYSASAAEDRRWAEEYERRDAKDAYEAMNRNGGRRWHD